MTRYYFEKRGSIVWINIPDTAAEFLKEAAGCTTGCSASTSKGALAKKVLKKNSDRALPLKGVPLESSVESHPYVATLGNKGI